MENLHWILFEKSRPALLSKCLIHVNTDSNYTEVAQYKVQIQTFQINMPTHSHYKYTRYPILQKFTQHSDIDNVHTVAVHTSPVSVLSTVDCTRPCKRVPTWFHSWFERKSPKVGNYFEIVFIVCLIIAIKEYCKEFNHQYHSDQLYWNKRLSYSY